MVSNLGLNEQVIIYDEYIPNEKVKEYFLIADVVVLPYRSATQSGILNLAYGFRKPVIVTKVGGLSEFVLEEKTGIIIDEPDSKKLADAIKKFFQIKDKIDFEQNISEFIKTNRFNNLNEIINHILELTNDSKN